MINKMIRVRVSGTIVRLVQLKNNDFLTCIIPIANLIVIIGIIGHKFQWTFKYS